MPDIPDIPAYCYENGCNNRKCLIQFSREYCKNKSVKFDDCVRIASKNGCANEDLQNFIKKLELNTIYNNFIGLFNEWKETLYQIHGLNADSQLTPQELYDKDPIKIASEPRMGPSFQELIKRKQKIIELVKIMDNLALKFGKIKKNFVEWKADVKKLTLDKNSEFYKKLNEMQIELAKFMNEFNEEIQLHKTTIRGGKRRKSRSKKAFSKTKKKRRNTRNGRRLN